MYFSDVNIEFHYYTVYFLAQRAGFSAADSWILACSSQFVDNNLIAYKIETDDGPYLSAATQNYGWWDKSYLNEVYLPFHFFPGTPDAYECRRKDGAQNPYNTTPNSPGVKKLLVEALKTKNLYRMGIALHTFADSYAHQNFSGKEEPWNALNASSVIPAIGHAQALKKPDDMCGVWSDPRIAVQDGLILNRERAQDCAKKIYRYLRIYLGKDPDDFSLILDYWDELLGKKGTEKPFDQRLYDYAIEWDIPPFKPGDWLDGALSLRDVSPEIGKIPQYDKLLWLKDAFVTRGLLNRKETVQAQDGFYRSHFYHWCEAAKEHKKTAHLILGPLIRDAD
jgi:hypothetical protein